MCREIAPASRWLASVWGIMVLAWIAVPVGLAAAGDTDLEGVVSRSIAELDDPSFEIRERAVDRLKGFGFASIRPAQEAAERGSLEVSVRAVDILESIYSTAGELLTASIWESEAPAAPAGDLPPDSAEPSGSSPEIPFAARLREFGIEPRSPTETTDAAESALEQLTLSKNRSVAAVSVTKLERNYVVREKRALTEIRKLGGAIDYMPQGPQVRRIPQAGPNPMLANDAYYIRIDRNWVGGDQGLEQIKRLSKLNTLYVIDGAKVSDEAIENLQTALPDLNVQFRGEAFLGISGHPNQVGGLGCLIDKVTEGGAAERAGIRPGDMIVSFGSKRVTDFSSLIEIIGTHKAGDKVAVQLRRGGRVEQLEVVLDGWSGPTQNPAP